MEDFGEILKEEYYTGKSIETLSRSYRLSRTKITALLKAAGTKMRSRPYISKDVIDSILAGYTQGLSMVKLSSKYNVSIGTVRNNLVKAGITIRSIGRDKKEDST